MREFVLYRGVKYWIQSSGRYYQSGLKELKPRLLHRKVWIDHYGEIPEGYVIHHKDHDWRNNDISNLEMMEMKKHLSDHAKELHKKEEYKENNRKSLEKAQEKAKEWHSSKDGIKWHKKHGKESWENRKTETIKCIVCGEMTETYFKNRKNVRFCSKKCAQKEGIKRYFTDNRKCVTCGNEFICNRHTKIINCSRKCGAIYRWNNNSSWLFK